jgi:cell wall-associated NlpC family hydrolase/peptidoglycan hydrolase-like protein with peptidoglycan-binding domain
MVAADHFERNTIMSTQQTALSPDDLAAAANLPVDDPATIPPDEGDIGSAPTLQMPATSQQPQMMAATLSGSQLADVHSLTLRAAELALMHRDAVHYTQHAPQRWEGINRRLYASHGQFPSYADCSSFVTWCLWNGMSAHNLPDTVNGENWQAGYTGTLLQHGTRVAGDASIQPCDLAIYGSGAPGKHVAICIGGGLVISHGSEAGPNKLPLHYRSDLMEVRRYLGAAPGPPPPPPPPGQLAVDGIFGPATIRKLQAVLHVTVDGQFGPATKVAFQRHLRVTPDGIIGPATVRALQAHVGAKVDGQWGPDTTRALQRSLNANKF